jgi:hypothetical protein
MTAHRDYRRRDRRRFRGGLVNDFGDRGDRRHRRAGWVPRPEGAAVMLMVRG